MKQKENSINSINSITRIRAWGMILNQVRAFQAKMREYGIEQVIADFNPRHHGNSAQDGNDPVFESETREFETHEAGTGKDPNRISLKEQNKRLAGKKFGSFPKRVHLAISNETGKEVIETAPTFSNTMLQASKCIFANVLDYHNAIRDRNESFCSFDLKLKAKGDIDIGFTVEGGSRRQCPVVERQHAFPEMAEWMEESVAQFRTALTEKFIGVLTNFVEEVNRDHPLDMVIDTHGEAVNITVNHEGSRTNEYYKALKALEQADPAFLSRFRELATAYAQIGGKIEIDSPDGVSFGIDKSSRIHVGPDAGQVPLVDNGECGDGPIA